MEAGETGKIALGVVAGLAIGAALGILFAPDKGSETRKKIVQKSSDMLNGIKDKFVSAAEETLDKAESGVNKAQSAVSSQK